MTSAATTESRSPAIIIDLASVRYLRQRRTDLSMRDMVQMATIPPEVATAKPRKRAPRPLCQSCLEDGKKTRATCTAVFKDGDKVTREQLCAQCAQEVIDEESAP